MSQIDQPKYRTHSSIQTLDKNNKGNSRLYWLSSWIDAALAALIKSNHHKIAHLYYLCKKFPYVLCFLQKTIKSPNFWNPIKTHSDCSSPNFTKTQRKIQNENMTATKRW